MNERLGDGIAVVPLQSCPQFAAVAASWAYFEWSVPMRRNWEDTLARYDPASTDDLPATFFATLDGVPAAMASLRSRDSYDFLPGATPWICNVYVHEGARGRGLATRLCQHIIGHAKDLGFGELFLATSVKADSLYHRLGFVEVHRLDYFGPKFILRYALQERDGLPERAQKDA
jgi:GNAT superfamily N-acetyltransferase